MEKIILTFIISLFSFCAYGQTEGIVVATMQKGEGFMKLYVNAKYPNTIVCMDINYHYMNVKLNSKYKFYKVGKKLGYKYSVTGKHVLSKKPVSFKKAINNMIRSMSQDSSFHSVFIKTSKRNYYKALHKFKSCYNNSVPYSKFIKQISKQKSQKK